MSTARVLETFRQEVSLAVVPMDAFTGQVVKRGVRVALRGRTDQPIRNLSGHHVFVDLEPDTVFEVDVEAGPAGYFDESFRFPDAANEDVDGVRALVRLLRRPSLPVVEGATVVAGVIVSPGRGGGPLSGVEISGSVPGAPGLRGPGEPVVHRTRSDEQGGFALPLRLPGARPPDGGPIPPVDVAFEFVLGARRRAFTAAIAPRFRNVFEESLTLTTGGRVPAIRRLQA